MEDKEKKDPNEAHKYPGYPHSPEGEDIYDREKETDMNIEGTSSNMEMDMDVPGSELDDALESVGEEDEENNYYSLDDQDDEADDDAL